MKAKEFVPASKPRNFVAKNQKTAGAGAHKDKKKAAKQGDVKHKGKVVAEGAGPDIATLDAVFNEHDFDRLEHIWPALEDGDKEEALRQINHYLRKGKTRAWWGDLQALDIKIDSSDVENSQVMWSKPINQEMEERVRDPEDWDEGNTEPGNNFAIYINGKKWKVLPGPSGAYADSPEERREYQRLKDMAQRKSQQTGKKWEVHITGEAPT